MLRVPSSFSQKMSCAAGFHSKLPTRRSQKPTPSTIILKKKKKRSPFRTKNSLAAAPVRTKNVPAASPAAGVHKKLYGGRPSCEATVAWVSYSLLLIFFWHVQG
jgi:hypothetical protein